MAPLIPKILSRYSSVVFEFIGAAPSGITSTERIRTFSPICEITKNISAFKSSGAGASDWRL